MKFTIDIDLEQYEGDNSSINGAKDFLDDIKNRIALQLLRNIWGYNDGDYNALLRTAVSDITATITRRVENDINIDALTKTITSRLQDQIIERAARTKAYREALTVLTTESEGALAAELRKIIRDEIKKAIRL